ncbi:MAG: 23S rRNA (pseudouridine(1915)-N(3))-methyltransferase RlmH [Syntrophomonadaceae bacterium]|nr:23S rRNA (pseudouridine(1915)-N(3))-methyltransferase RlmH [Syntrophomonadaceae bacterium]
MKYRIISVGKIKEKIYSEGINEYLKRLRPYTTIELVDGLEEKVNPRAGIRDIEKVLNKEGERILSLLGDHEFLIVLDVQGTLLSSDELSNNIAAWNMSGVSRVNFVIGGSHGLANTVKHKADRLISFSKMTFPHQMAVLMLSEQIYRGFKILKGEPYHK